MSYKSARYVLPRGFSNVTVTMQLWIIGFLCITAVRNYAPAVDASPLGPAGGSASFRSNTGQSAPFAEGLRDWFRNVKNRIAGAVDVQAQPPPEAANMIMQLENEDPQERRRNNPGGFFLDLTNLTFNPDRDWGFRLGQWYFIRKTNDDPPAVDWNSSNYPEWPSMDDGKDYDLPPLGTIKSIDETTTVAVTPAAKEPPTFMEPSAMPEPKDSDNETQNGSESMQSAEVLIPSE